MSFYLRKNLVKAGPLRINLNKTGLSVSGGVPGMRVGKGPQGAYVRMGRDGVYYRKTLSTKPRRPSAQPRSAAPQAQLVQAAPEADTKLAVMELAPAHPSDLVAHMNTAARRRQHRFVTTLLYLPVVTIPLALWLRARFRARTTVAVFYDVEDHHAQKFEHLVGAFAQLQQCAGCWYITESARLATTQRRKANSGASETVHRAPARLGTVGPKQLATNIIVPSIAAGSMTVHFLPDRVLVASGRQFVELPYATIAVRFDPERFIEAERVPKDAHKVGTTWRYVNVSGGPDKRYRDNRQLPIMEYGELRLSAGTSWRLRLQTSQPDAARVLAQGISQMAK